MTAYYVRPEGVDTNNGLSWAAAVKTLAAAYNLMAGTDVCYVSKRTIETSASAYTLTYDTGLSYVCVDDSQAPSLVPATGATVTTNNFTTAGTSGYVEGLTISPNANQTITLATGKTKYKNCTFNPTYTSVGGLTIGNSGTAIELVDCTINFNNLNQCFVFNSGKYIIRGGAVTASVKLTSLVNPASGSGVGFDILFDGVDLSGLDANALMGSVAGCGRITFRRCKLKSTFAGVIGASRMTSDAMEILLIECDVDGAGLTYRYEVDMLNGEIKGRTSTYRVGGAQVSGFNVSWDCNIRGGVFPLCFYTPELIAYNENTTGPVTVTLEFLAAKAGLTVGEFWMELSYLGDTASMKGAIATSEPASYVNKSALVSTSSATWVGTPANYTAYKISLTVSPKQVGTLIARMRANLVGNIIVDPYLTVT
jgi:hypothetical protein